MVSQKASFLQGAFLGSTIVFWEVVYTCLLKCLQIHHYLILYFYQTVPEITGNIQQVLSGCYSYNEQLSFQEWDNLSLSVSGFSHQQFSVEIHGSYYK